MSSIPAPGLAIDRFGNEKDGECDFVVAHERMGVLAIEVKGGGIAFDPERVQWTSTDEHGVVHNIKDPVGQARSAKHNILDKLKNSRRWARKWVTLRHGVIFPDAATPSGNLGADRPARIFCASRRFAHDLAGWISDRLHDSPERIWKRWRLGSGRNCGVGASLCVSLHAEFQDLCMQYRKMFGVSIILEPQQFLVLDYISNIPRARIEGAAGTGKTVLALEDAVRSGEKRQADAFDMLQFGFGQGVAKTPSRCW